jgi:NDP-sugar pyrophosphorylase family protein
MIPVAILCGGLGSRLGALTSDVPKPMIAIGGRPFLERVVESFATRGLRTIVLLTGYRSDVIERHFGDGSRFGVDIRYSVELEPLGTGGAVREARPLLGSRFILTYGDVLRQFAYDRFVSERQGSCLAAYPRITFGNTTVEGDRVTRFDRRARDLGFVDAGFSVMETSSLNLLPEGASSFEEVVYSTLAECGELGAEVVDHAFYDIGTPDELARTRVTLEER